MHIPCLECNRLHLIHAETIRVHTEVVRRYQQAKLRRDTTAILSIKPMVRMASEDRDRANQAILAHSEATARMQAGR